MENNNSLTAQHERTTQRLVLDVLPSTELKGGKQKMEDKSLTELLDYFYLKKVLYPKISNDLNSIKELAKETGNKPATKKQLDFLVDIGFEVTEEITRNKASRIIQRILEAVEPCSG